MTVYWITGDAREVMAELLPGTVDLVVTSPPFLALRSYLLDDDPAKADEIGSEANPAEFVDTLLDVTEACARLLAPHGTLCVELGDTYAGNGGSGGADAPKFRSGTPRWDGRPDGQVRTTDSDPVVYPPRGARGWPLDKSLSLIPEAYRMALAYGRNPHNGRETDPWRIRNVIRWVRPNPPVGALGDKFRPATSEMVVACKARDRWFDLDAVRSAPSPNAHARGPKANGGLRTAPEQVTGARNDDGQQMRHNGDPAGAPPLDWWQISPGGYSGAHYATWPPELCVKPIEAMCPRRVCRTCSKPSRRLVDGDRTADLSKVSPSEQALERDVHGPGRNKRGTAWASRTTGTGTTYTTTGWSSCGCPGSDGIRLDGYHTGPGWRPGVVLDPFGGSGTTAAVASGHSRDSVSIDLDARNADLARDRIGMWFRQVTPAELAAS